MNHKEQAEIESIHRSVIAVEDGLHQFFNSLSDVAVVRSGLSPFINQLADLSTKLGVLSSVSDIQAKTVEEQSDTQPQAAELKYS